MIRRWSVLFGSGLLMATCFLVFAPAGNKGAKALNLTLRSREPSDKAKDGYAVMSKEAKWPAADTAIIVCDVWDAHHCLNAVRRDRKSVV